MKYFREVRKGAILIRGSQKASFWSWDAKSRAAPSPFFSLGMYLQIENFANDYPFMRNSTSCFKQVTKS